MMTAEQLKNSILQLAMQGKLVEQRPEEGTGEELYKHIQTIRTELSISGLAKKAKKTTEIIEDEYPFEIPSNWMYVRLGDLISVISGVSYKKGDVKDKGIRVLRGGNISNMKVSLENDDVFLPAEYEDKQKQVQKGDILIVASTGSKKVIGKPGYVDRNIPNTMIGAFLRICRPLDTSLSPYLQLIFGSEHYRKHIRDLAQGTNINNVKEEYITGLVIPLPPLEEQKRIVTRIEELMPFVEQYAEANTRLNTLNATFPDMMKKSILQEAVQGKLVPQDPNDEPASELLKRIAEEKQRLIKEGKIKKDKNISKIVCEGRSWFEIVNGEKVCIDDEIPFEVPNNWSWIRLNELGDYKKGPFGSALTKSMFVPAGNDSVKVYEQKNAIQKDWTLGEYYIRKAYYEDKMVGFTVEPGDVIVSCAGTIGETYIMPENIEIGIINQALMRMKIYEPMNVNYFLMYFDYVIKESAREQSKGSAIKNIPPFSIFKKILFPVPPLAEQKRILDSLSVIMDEIDKLIV